MVSPPPPQPPPYQGGLAPNDSDEPYVPVIPRAIPPPLRGNFNRGRGRGNFNPNRGRGAYHSQDFQPYGQNFRTPSPQPAVPGQTIPTRLNFPRMGAEFFIPQRVASNTTPAGAAPPQTTTFTTPTRTTIFTAPTSTAYGSSGGRIERTYRPKKPPAPYECLAPLVSGIEDFFIADPRNPPQFYPVSGLVIGATAVTDDPRALIMCKPKPATPPPGPRPTSLCIPPTPPTPPTPPHPPRPYTRIEPLDDEVVVATFYWHGPVGIEIDTATIPRNLDWVRLGNNRFVQLKKKRLGTYGLFWRTLAEDLNLFPPIGLHTTDVTIFWGPPTPGVLPTTNPATYTVRQLRPPINKTQWANTLKRMGYVYVQLMPRESIGRLSMRERAQLNAVQELYLSSVPWLQERDRRYVEKKEEMEREEMEMEEMEKRGRGGGVLIDLTGDG